MDFLPDGRLVVCTWDPDGAVYILSGVQGEREKVKVKRIAFGLAEPLGLKVVGREIYVLQKQELTQLVDRNGDDVIDEYRSIANGWGVTSNFHEFAFGLAYKEGKFYANLALAIDPGGRSTQRQNPDRGKAMEISKDGRIRFVAHGLRTPNGVGLGYRNEIFIADNQGDWLPSSKILHLKEGAFFGSRAVDPIGTASRREQPPSCGSPRARSVTRRAGPPPLNDGPYKGTDGARRRHPRRREARVHRGGRRGAPRLRVPLHARARGGINRLAWGPDGALYVGGIGSTGNWGQEGKERFGLQRLEYNGKPAFEMRAVRARPNGIEIELTEPLGLGLGQGLGLGGETSLYTVGQWRYQPTETYGGPKIDERTLKVRSATVSRDRRKISLALDGMKPGHVSLRAPRPASEERDGPRALVHRSVVHDEPHSRRRAPGGASGQAPRRDRFRPRLGRPRWGCPCA